MPDPARRLLTIERPPGAEPVMKIDGHDCRVVTIYVRDSLIKVLYEEAAAIAQTAADPEAEV